MKVTHASYCEPKTATIESTWAVCELYPELDINNPGHIAISFIGEQFVYG